MAFIYYRMLLKPSLRTSLRSMRTHRRQLVRTRVFERFSESSIKLVMLCQNEAYTSQSAQVYPEHVLLSLLESEVILLGNGRHTVEEVRSIAAVIRTPVLNSIDVPPLLPKPGLAPGMSMSEIPISSVVRTVFQRADALSKKAQYIMPYHVFMALMDVGESETIVRNILKMLGVQSISVKTDDIHEDPVTASKPPPEDLKYVGEYCTDLCERAREGFVDPVFGRDAEIERVIQILVRRTKSNPILIGEPGVGKTAIAEGLAYMLVFKPESLPEALRDCRVLALDMNALIAGTKERGEFEERLTNLIKEVKTDPRIILFIDEIHGLVMGAENAEEPLCAANIMKPPLARGELRCIGATTLYEYQRYFEKDAALERRFQPVVVEEPSESQARKILEGLVPIYESYHVCKFTPDVLDRIIQVCRLIGDRRLPDKAIDIMDEIGSKLRASSKKSDRLDDLRTFMRDRDDLVRLQDYEKASEASVLERTLRLELADQGSVLTATLADVDDVIESWTGIRPRPPVTIDRVRSLVHSTIIGQNHAKDTVVSAVARAFAGFRSPKRPIASMLFVGPTGVGKTAMAKAIASSAFAGNLVRVDMSELQEQGSMSRLVGSPPGYVGYDEPGYLTEALRRTPQCLVLLDEVEKAHPRVLDVLLQILEDGRLTDAKGRVVSFRESMIVLTSNLGSSHARPGSNKGGFFAGQGNQEDPMGAVQRFFRPEIMNRFDDIIVFDRLDLEDLKVIARSMVSEVMERLPEGTKVHVDPGLVDCIARAAHETEGPRAIRRFVTSWVEDKIADAIIRDGHKGVINIKISDVITNIP
jgi:ATP-dependent Clp protease ATP-binding subunit ClpC